MHDPRKASDAWLIVEFIKPAATMQIAQRNMEDGRLPAPMFRWVLDDGGQAPLSSRIAY